MGTLLNISGPPPDGTFDSTYLNSPKPPIIKPVAAFPFNIFDATAAGYWIEQVGDESPNSSDAAAKYAREVLYAYVPDDADAYYSFENSVLGYHVTDQSLQFIKRTNPAQHPRKKNLYAQRITGARGIKFAGRQDPPQDGTLQSYAKYSRRLLAVEFAPLKYDPWKDNQIGGYTQGAVPTPYREQFRYVEYGLKPNVYPVSVAAGWQFKWAENPAKTNAINFQGELNWFEVKTTFNVTWRFVPEDFVLASFNIPDSITQSAGGTPTTVYYSLKKPTKILAAAGHVNSTPFMGYAAGTLLMLEPEIDRYVSGTVRLANDSNYWMCDVTLPIVEFDPPLGNPTGYIQRGHNTKPWYSATAADGSAAKQPLYYYVSSDGSAQGIPIYGGYDFNLIFTHWYL